MTLPLVSIIIPTLNEEKYLPLCLQSVQELDYPKEKIEVIVVDNGSTDKTQQIVREFGAKLLIEPDKYISGLRNVGAKIATGEILAFIDADCVAARSWLINASEYIYNSEVIAWGCPPEIPDNATWVQKTWYLVRQKKEQVQEVDWLESMNFFIRKKGFSEN